MLLGAFAFIIQISYLLPFAMIPIFWADKAFYVSESALGLYESWAYCLSQAVLEARGLAACTL